MELSMYDQTKRKNILEEYSKQGTIKANTEFVAIAIAFDRLRQFVSDQQNKLKDARSKIDNDRIHPKTVMVCNKRNALNFQLSHIFMFEANNNYFTIYLADCTTIFNSKTIKYWGQKIKDNQEFMRTHRSYIINKTHLLSYEPSSKTIELTGGFLQKYREHLNFK